MFPRVVHRVTMGSRLDLVVRCELIQHSLDVAELQELLQESEAPLGHVRQRELIYLVVRNDDGVRLDQLHMEHCRSILGRNLL